MLVKIAQQKAFASDYVELVKHGVVRNESNLLSLTSILVDQIIRVEGRLKNSFYPLEKIHPALIPQKHILLLSLSMRNYFTADPNFFCQVFVKKIGRYLEKIWLSVLCMNVRLFSI